RGTAGDEAGRSGRAEAAAQTQPRRGPGRAQSPGRSGNTGFAPADPEGHRPEQGPPEPQGHARTLTRVPSAETPRPRGKKAAPPQRESAPLPIPAHSPLAT